MARMLVRWCLALGLISMLGGCRCGKPSIANQYGEIVVVVPVGQSEVLTREATLTLEPVAMTAQGTSQARLRNVGNTALTLTTLSQRSGSTAFTVALPAQTELRNSSETTLEITFTPPQDADATLASVEHRALFALETLGTREGERLVTLELVASAVARDCLLPAVIDFGVVPLGRTALSPLTLKNQSALAQTPTLGPLEGDDPAFFARVGAAPQAIGAGETREVAFSFSPTTERVYSATLSARRAASCPEARVRLTGSGSNDVVSWSPSVLDFGKLPLAFTVSRELTFTNRTNSPLQLTALKVSGEGFKLSSPTALALAPKGTGALLLTCTATSLGKHEGELVGEIDTQPTRSVRVPLVCTGGGPRIRAKPSPDLIFEQVPFVSASQPLSTTRRLTIQNVGTLPQSESDTSSNLFLGKGGKPPIVFIAPANGNTNARELSVSLLGWNSVNGLPATPGKNAVDLDVQLTPSSTGFKQATLTVYSNDALEPELTVTIKANVVAATYCTLEVDPVSISFGDLPPGSVLKRTIDLKNTSANPCLISGLEIAPGSDPMFELQGSGYRTVPGMQTLPVTVVVTTPPTAIEGSTPSGFLRFQVNSSTTPNVLVPLGVRIAPCLIATPNALDYGTVKVGCRSSAKSVTLYNACSQSITLRSLELEPAGELAITASPTIPPAGLDLAPGAPQPVQLVFSPTVYTRVDRELVASVLEAGVAKTIRVPLTGIGSTSSTNTDTFIQPAQTPADLLLVVDDSCSMSDKQAALAANFASFIAYANQLGVPYQIGVTTTDDTPLGPQGRLLRTAGNPMVLTPTTPNVAARFAEKVNVGTLGSGVESPLAAALKAVTAPLTNGTNRGFLRPDASLSIVIVSDAPDQSPAPASYYLNRFMTLVPSQQAWLFTFSTIGPFTLGTLPQGCTIDSTPDQGRYEPIITASNGVKVDICTQNWARDLEAIGKNALGPRSTLYLTSVPDLTQPVTILVNGRLATNYTIDPVTNAVVFHDTKATPPGSSIKVTYATACF